MFLHNLAVNRKLPIARWANDNLIACPRALAAGAFHCFVSHEWGHGQDQARAVKAEMSALVPGLKCFLEYTVGLEPATTGA